jgi:hypothetical protein
MNNEMYFVKMSRNMPYNQGSYNRYFNGTLKELSEKCYLKRNPGSIEKLINSANNRNDTSGGSKCYIAITQEEFELNKKQ